MRCAIHIVSLHGGKIERNVIRSLLWFKQKRSILFRFTSTKHTLSHVMLMLLVFVSIRLERWSEKVKSYSNNGIRVSIRCRCGGLARWPVWIGECVCAIWSVCACVRESTVATNALSLSVRRRAIVKTRASVFMSHSSELGYDDDDDDDGNGDDSEYVYPFLPYRIWKTVNRSTMLFHTLEMW